MHKICCGLCSGCVPLFLTTISLSRIGTYTEKSTINYFPLLPYKDACKILNLDDLGTHHDKLCSNLFENILKDPYHKLYDLLPERCENTKYNLRHPRMFDLPKYELIGSETLLSYRVALGRTQKNF